MFDGQFVNVVMCYSLINPGFCIKALMDASGFSVETMSVLVTSVCYVMTFMMVFWCGQE